MKRRGTSYEDSDYHPKAGGGGGGSGGDSLGADEIHNIRTKGPKIYDNITRRLLQLGVTLSIITFVGLIVRYAVQEFDPSISTITVTTSRVNNRDIASLSVSKNFLERILEFTEESIAIVAAIIPIGFPLCTIFNRHFARIRSGGSDKIEINNNKVLNMIPKYVVIGDGQACQLPNSQRLRPLVRDTIYQLIKSQLKPKLIVEDSYEEARKLGIRIGLIGREHHKLAVIKSVDLLRNITDSRGDIKQDKVRYLLSKMKIMSQSTPADKSLLIYLIKCCEQAPNENLAYLGYSFTDPEAMRVADCALTFQDCDDDDVKQAAQVVFKSESMTFTDLYLFLLVCLMSSNIIQSYALYQISASVSCCIYRFLSITVFQEQLISRSQFALLVILQQVFAILALMTKWLSSLPRAPLHAASMAAEMSHAATDDTLATRHQHQHHHRSTTSISNQPHHHHNKPVAAATTSVQMAPREISLSRSSSPASSSSSPSSSPSSSSSLENLAAVDGTTKQGELAKEEEEQQQHMSHLSGIDLDQAVMDSRLALAYKQTFHSSQLIDDVTYRLTKLHIAYQILVMVIIMLFGNAMFQLNMNNNRQHQTLAFNSLMMNSIFNLCNCFNQFGQFNLRSGFRNHPFFVCCLLMAVFVQVSLTELNAFGLENLNPIQWFVCFVFALLGALIAPLTGQQQRQRGHQHHQPQHHHQHPQPNQHQPNHQQHHHHHQHHHHQKSGHQHKQQQQRQVARKKSRPASASSKGARRQAPGGGQDQQTPRRSPGRKSQVAGG